jgi:glyoxylase-like metal-dependent hydrolase (beta-lactamase superfamily II)
MSNSGIVLTDAGVVIVDTGGSWEIGQRIIDEIRALTEKPVVAVFNTHIHGDHWLGNSAIQETFPRTKFYAHTRAIERLESGASRQWSEMIGDMIGSDPANGAMVLPDKAVDGGESFEFGDRTLIIHHTGHAHTDSDIMLEIPDARLLFAGDIIEHGRAVSSDVPVDFNAKGQIEAIRYALELPVDTFVPGHGVTGDREIGEDALRFLEILYASVEEYYEGGMLDFEMRALVAADLEQFSDWFNFDELGRLISFVYQQVEAEAFK